MAFGFDYLYHAELSMFPDDTQNAMSGNVNGKAINIWTYNASAGGANDTTAATQAANYFNPASGYMSVGDVIFVQSNNPAFHILNVTVNAAGVVTVVQAV